MHELRKLQAAFAASIFDGRAFDRVSGWLAPAESDAARFAIYRRGVIGNLTSALRAIFPVVERLVGGEFFDRAAAVHVSRCPSRSGDVNDYGGGFPDFLAGFHPLAGLPYLPSVARLEWTLQHVFHAGERPPLDLARLATVPPEHYASLRFELHPAVRLFESEYPVHRIWQVNQDGQAGDEQVDLDDGGVRLLARRHEHTIVLETLSAAHWTFLRSLAAGLTFGAACELALQQEEATDIGALLPHLVRNDIITGFYAPVLNGAITSGDG